MSREPKNDTDAEKACSRVHEILEGLPDQGEPTDRLPKKGIYFFFEEGETTPHTGKLRIVRIGTHGDKRTLKERLKEHHNGNREGSVFRKHLGSALLKLDGAPDGKINEWNKKRKSKRWSEFNEIEHQVNELLRTRLHFKVIQIDNEEERGAFEEKLIATIAACSICEPTDNWLGNRASSEKVRRSGLWNVDFVDSSARLSFNDLSRLEQMARNTT